MPVALRASLFQVTLDRMVFHYGYKNDERQAANFADKKPCGLIPSGIAVRRESLF